jgi:hypothetical protein
MTAAYKSSIEEYTEECIRMAAFNKVGERTENLKVKLALAQKQINEAEQYKEYFRRNNWDMMREVRIAMQGLDDRFRNYILWEESRFHQLKTNAEKLHGVDHYNNICDEFVKRIEIVNNASKLVIKDCSERMYHLK